MVTSAVGGLQNKTSEVMCARYGLLFSYNCRIFSKIVMILVTYFSENVFFFRRYDASCDAQFCPVLTIIKGNSTGTTFHDCFFLCKQQ